MKRRPPLLHPSGCGPTGIAVREDQPCWCQDFCNDPMTAPWHERGRAYGWRASAALPLHREGRVVGAISLYATEPDAFDGAARALLNEMAMDVDFALERFRQEAERERLVVEIAEREAKYRILTETINDVIWVMDPETLRFLYVSPSVQRLPGYTPEEIMAEPMDAALTPEGSQHVRAHENVHHKTGRGGTPMGDCGCPGPNVGSFGDPGGLYFAWQTQARIFPVG